MTTFSVKNRTSIICVFLLCIMGLNACKKDKTSDLDINTKIAPSSEGSRRDLTLDSIYLYAKQIYFWNDAIPDYATFKPRSYSSKSVDLDNYDDELYAITQLKKDPTTGIPYEYYGDGFPKFSYIQDKTTNNPNVISANNKSADVDTEGNGFDIGIRPVYYITDSPTSGSYFLFVTAVYPGSPAAAAGVQRGWLINKVNGMSVGANYNSERARVNSALDGTSVKIEGYNFMDNIPFSLTLNQASYKSSPVYAAKVINRGGKKIGYLAFARFSTLTDENGNSDANLDPVFADFNTQGVTDLVIDLRYNGGGFISTAEHLANLIAPSSLSGKTMYIEAYNATMQSNPRNTILKNQPLLTSAGKVQFQNGKMITYDDIDYSIAGNTVNFSKKGPLNSVTSIVFIVTDNTASASELLINSFKPYMSVKLVGDTTYGKPVGFFPITLENRYELYMSQFETRNANNEGGYYRGFTPTKLNLFDDPRYPFGNENEGYLADALQLIAPAAATLANQSATMSAGQRSLKIASFGTRQLKPAKPKSEFVGMIETRHKLKK